jgi:hypothetical protein
VGQMTKQHIVTYYGDMPNESMGGYSFQFQSFVDKFDIKASETGKPVPNELTEEQAAYTMIVLGELVERESLIISPKVTDSAIASVQAKIDLVSQQEADRNLSPESRVVKETVSILSSQLAAMVSKIDAITATLDAMKSKVEPKETTKTPVK